MVNNISEPIFWSFLALPLVLLSLFFVRRDTFVTWVKFSAFTFPLMLGALLYMFNYSDWSGRGSLMGIFPSPAQVISVCLPPLFVLISLVIILVKQVRGKTKV